METSEKPFWLLSFLLVSHIAQKHLTAAAAILSMHAQHKHACTHTGILSVLLFALHFQALNKKQTIHTEN